MRPYVLALLCLPNVFLPAHAQWQRQDAHTTADLRGIDNVGGGVAWVSGSNGTILRTEDAGIVWQLCAKPPGGEHLDFRAIQALDNNTAIIMSIGKGVLSRLYKTTDGCQSWTLLFTNPDKDGFWDTLIMTGSNIGMLIGDPIVPSSATYTRQQGRPVFPTYHTVDGGLTWNRNDHNRLLSQTDDKGEPTESIFAASNSAMILLPYTVLFVTGGKDAALHDEQYTFEHVGVPCPRVGVCVIEGETASELAKGDSAGGFSLAANWSLSPESTGSQLSQPQLHTRNRNPDPHTVVIVGGDYKLLDERSGTASVCIPAQDGAVSRFSCRAATTSPHGFRSAVAYYAPTKTWITVGPNGTDISTDNGRNWRSLHPDPKFHDTPDADQHWNALSLPYAVGPHGRIGKLRDDALKP
jgi:hypothetical protein